MRYQGNTSCKHGLNKGQKWYGPKRPKKRWQEYTEELYKKDLHDPDNHNGVITYLEPDVLECEVKWALESITVNKASGGDGIPVELFQILNDAVKVLHLISQQIWKTQQWPQWQSQWKWSRSVVSDSLRPRELHSPPGSSVHGILQARILEWVAISFSRGSSWPRDRTQVSQIAGRCFNLWATREAQDWKRSLFVPIPKKGNAKECSNYHTIALNSQASKVMLKTLQARLQQYVNRDLSNVQAGFRKGRGTRD